MVNDRRRSFAVWRIDTTVATNVRSYSTVTITRVNRRPFRNSVAWHPFVRCVNRTGPKISSINLSIIHLASNRCPSRSCTKVVTTANYRSNSTYQRDNCILIKFPTIPNALSTLPTITAYRYLNRTRSDLRRFPKEDERIRNYSCTTPNATAYIRCHL